MDKAAPTATRILLVDDNLHGIAARKMILAEQGYEVETALSGEEGWDLFRRSRFDIVVTDLRMSGMDGIELISRIRGSESPVRTILLSGFVGAMRISPAQFILAEKNR